jgi:hypothetical protein
MSQEEPWGAQILAVKALTEPNEIATYNLTELSLNEIKLLTTLHVLAKGLSLDILDDFIIQYARLKRSYERKGERGVINAIRGAGAKFLQNVQVSRFKRLYSNIKEDEYE